MEKYLMYSYCGSWKPGTQLERRASSSSLGQAAMVLFGPVQHWAKIK